MKKLLFQLNIQLFGEDDKKAPTIEDLQKEINELKKSKEEEITSLKTQLDEEKRKNAQYVLASMGGKAPEEKEEEEVQFDFKF